MPPRPQPKSETPALPIQYRDGSAVYFYFTVPSKLVAEILDGSFEPAPLAFGQTIAALCFFEYRDSSIGAYNELGLGVTVRGDRKAPWLPLDLLRGAKARTTGFHILSLPVTSEAANQAGRTIWGFPKFVTEIPFRLEGRRFEASGSDPKTAKKTLFSVESQLGRGVPSKGLDLVLLNRGAAGNEKSIVNTQAQFTSARCPEFTLTIAKGDHPLQSLLRTLNLDSQAPLMAQYTTRFISQLHGPLPFGP
jgi:hypothetical protein